MDICEHMMQATLQATEDYRYEGDSPVSYPWNEFFKSIKFGQKYQF